MSSAIASQALAIQLNSSATLSTEQRLFREALQNVEDRACEAGQRPAFFDILYHAQNVEDLNYILQSTRKSNKFWSEDVGKSWLKNLSKLAERILVYKGLVDSIASRSADLASPIIGTLSFILGVLKDLSATASKLEDVASTLEHSIRRFSRYFDNGKVVSSSVQLALVNYYEIVVNFVVEVHGEFSAGKTRTMFNAVHKTLNAKLVELTEKIHHAIDHVDKGVSIDQFQIIGNRIETLSGTLGLALTQQASGRSSPQSTLTRGLHNLPIPNHQFSGRVRYLSAIFHSFKKQQGTLARTALYGMGGIGKTQVLQKYAYDQLGLQKDFRRIVVYIDASSPASIKANVLTFMRSNAAKYLIDDPGDDHNFSQFHAWLLSQEDWLLVLDNIQDYDHVRSVVPRGDRGQVLCSTRHHLIAEMLAGDHVLEVGPMDETESKVLIHSLTRKSSFEDDKSEEAHLLVRDYAKGIPILMEQIVHNALFSKTSIRNIVAQIQEKKALLQHRNLSSLHEDNLSLGGVVMQAFDAIKSRSDKAEALLSVLAYLEPSWIPVRLIRDGAQAYQSFLMSPRTYDRGAVRKVEGSYRVCIDRDAQDSTTTVSTKKERPSWRLWSRHSKPKQSGISNQEGFLPVDDKDQRLALMKVCGPGTPFGRLFDNKDTIDDAIVTLCNAAIIRYTDQDTLWMHDLVSEIAKALIESRPDPSPQQVSVLAATTVYLSFPHPAFYSNGNWELKQKYLSHALSCHNALKSAGILNDFAIGPELSHLIASTTFNDRPKTSYASGREYTSQEIESFDKRVLGYYIQAYEGYMAGWNRLKLCHRVTDAQIRLTTIRDRDHELKLDWLFTGKGFTEGVNRYGRAAPWRAIQTAAKIYWYLSYRMKQYSEAQKWLKIVLDFCESTFDHSDDTVAYFRECMAFLLGDQEDWQAAYYLNLQHIAELLKCSVTDLTHDRVLKTDWTEFSDLPRGSRYVQYAGFFALRHATTCQKRGDRKAKLLWSKTALVFLELAHRQAREFYGERIYMFASDMQFMASAYEVDEQFRTAMFYFAQGVICAFDTKDIYSELDAPSAFDKNRAIKGYEEAKIRLYGIDEFACYIAWEQDAELKELIDLCDGKARHWKETYEPSIQQRDPEDDIDWDALYAQPFDLHEDGPSSSTTLLKSGEDNKENLRLEDIYK